MKATFIGYSAGRRTLGDMDEHRLRTSVERQHQRAQQAKEGGLTFLARTAYLGSIGIMLALPIVAGAYLGRWLDDHQTGFSFSWTVSLIVIGVAVGVGNVVMFIRQTWR